jgi:hypothetical protein
VLRFEEIVREDRFDGIWACASLLHVPPAELPEVLRRPGRALKPDGVFMPRSSMGQGNASMGAEVYGSGRSGFAAVPALGLLETWFTGDRRPGREGERWLNAIVAREWPSRAVRRMCGQPHEPSGPAEGAT